MEKERRASLGMYYWVHVHLICLRPHLTNSVNFWGPKKNNHLKFKIIHELGPRTGLCLD